MALSHACGKTVERLGRWRTPDRLDNPHLSTRTPVWPNPETRGYEPLIVAQTRSTTPDSQGAEKYKR